jgi:hypothetical protein
MKRTYLLLVFMSLIASVATVSAQNQHGGTTLRCPTSDGNIIIARDYITFRDYTFKVDQSSEAGVITLSDRSAGVTAQLDLRSESGLYFCVNEHGRRMQLVAQRAAISTTFDTPAQQPESSISSADVFHERMDLVNLVQLGEFADAR